MRLGVLWALPIAFGLLSGCDQIPFVQASTPTTKDDPVQAGYVVPDIKLAPGSKTTQTDSGVEIRVSTVPFSDSQVFYQVAATASQGSFLEMESSPPHSSPDPVWDAFCSRVYEYPMSSSNNNTPVDPLQHYLVTLSPIVNTVPDRLRFQITFINHTARTIKTSLTPKVAVDGRIWNEESARVVVQMAYVSHDQAAIAAAGNEISHDVSLGPGETGHWEFPGPWVHEEFPTANTKGGTIVLTIPDVMVDPVNMKTATYRFVFDYQTKRLTKATVTKSGEMSLRRSVAETLNGQVVP